jgi:hypothetical protein
MISAADTHLSDKDTMRKLLAHPAFASFGRLRRAGLELFCALKARGISRSLDHVPTC